MQSKSPILGIWDGHDAGAALVLDSKILSAINEERLSRRKLDIGFPELSVKEVLKQSNISPAELRAVAVSTSDFAKTLTRIFPSLKESYYLLRRRKVDAGPLYKFKKLFKYKVTEISPSFLTKTISRASLSNKLNSLGIPSDKLMLVDHHSAHAASAAFCSGFSKALVLTIDGIGDGLSGSIWSLSNSKLELLKVLRGDSSLGIFFEHVTNLLNMRELEDEGKVMALSNYAFPIPAEENPMLRFFQINGMELKCVCGSASLYRELSKIFFRYPSEQFASMAQQTLELKVCELVRNALSESGHEYLAYAGGVASNVKVNMLLREIPGLKGFFVFPHMGDGGLALGSAIWAGYLNGIKDPYPLNDVFLGPSYSNEDIISLSSQYPELKFENCSNVVSTCAELIREGKIVMWFNGRMEYGPRALGHRSILARPDSLDIKDQLNLCLKKRVWYQPFCPSLLSSDASEILEAYDGVINPFMTCAYRVKKGKESLMQGVINVDKTCRPQILPDDDPSLYGSLLREIKRQSGHGVLLNTSFNLHGEPLVCSPEDALRTFSGTEASYLFMEDFLITKRS